MTQIIEGIVVILKWLVMFIIVLILWNLIKIAARFAWWSLLKARDLIAMAAGFNPKARLLGTRLLIFAVVSSFLLHPLYLIYAVKYPIRYAENMGRLWLGFTNAKIDIKRTVSNVIPDSIETWADHIGNRYQVKAVYNTMGEATGHKSVPWYHKLLSPWNWV